MNIVSNGTIHGMDSTPSSVVASDLTRSSTPRPKYNASPRLLTALRLSNAVSTLFHITLGLPR